MPKSRIKVDRDAVLPRIQETRDWWLCVIAVEGERREKQYFTTIHTRFNNSRVRVDILPTYSGDSSEPSSILQRLQRYKQDNDVKEQDQCWLVFDVDDREEPLLLDICTNAKNERFKLAISNPCFELWLFLHRYGLDEVPNEIHNVSVALRPHEMKSILDQMLQGYSYHSLLPKDFLADLQSAIKRARQNERNRRKPFPGFPGSDVYRLVETLIKPPLAHINR